MAIALDVPVARWPSCPDGHGGRVSPWGFRRRTDRLYPLTLTSAKVPAVRLAGLRLRDLPLIRREWDPANALDPDAIAATHYKEEVGWVCWEDPSHRWRQTVGARCQRLNGCPECQRVRGAAAQGTITPREHLQRIRDAWGDYEEAVPQAACGPQAIIDLDPADEDF